MLQLRTIDGLTEFERSLRFDGLRVSEGNRAAVESVRAASEAGRGLVTLSGNPGTGKTTLLVCAVNAAREAGIEAVYTTVTDLLDWLRLSFEPRPRQYAWGEEPEEPGFNARWELLVRAPLLALDEMDEFKQSDWALERFQRLIDERWRAMETRLTLLATNARLSLLPPKVASRLRDGRASTVTLAGVDFRPASEW